MPSSAIDGQGVTLTIDGTSIGEMLDFEGPGMEAEEHEVTNHGSTDGVEEIILGIRRWQPMKFEVNYVPSSAGHAKLVSMNVNRTIGAASLTWPDGTTTWAGNCFVKSFMPKAPVNGVFTADVEIKPTGVWTGLT